jgi:transposase
MGSRSAGSARSRSPTSTADQENRRLTTLRKEAGVARARLINKVKWVLRRHNLQWGMPTRTFPTVAAITWVKGLALPEVDRLETDYLLADLERADKRLRGLEQAIARRSAAIKDVAVLSSMPGVRRGFTALSQACRVGRVERFPRAAKGPSQEEGGESRSAGNGDRPPGPGI